MYQFWGKTKLVLLLQSKSKQFKHFLQLKFKKRIIQALKQA